MRLNILCDADSEAKVDKVLHYLSGIEYRRFFEERNYGNTIVGVTLVLMCQDSQLKLKQRIRFSKKEKKLYIDLMLDLLQFKQIDQVQRNKIVTDKIINQVPSIIAKYKFADFELTQFESDLKKIFKQIQG
jgi:hypothetical protein